MKCAVVFGRSVYTHFSVIGHQLETVAGQKLLLVDMSHGQSGGGQLVVAFGSDGVVLGAQLKQTEKRDNRLVIRRRRRRRR